MGKFLLVFFMAGISAMASAATLKDMKSWGYQLHDYSDAELARMKSSKNTLWVIDYSKDGDEATRFSASEIAQIKKNGNMVIAYFCLGEAEMVRYYWDTLGKEALISASEASSIGYKREFLANTTTVGGVKVLARNNSEYLDNLPAKFWDYSWQSTMINTYLPKIMEAGFDGVYLDTVDAFEYYNDSVIDTRAKQMYDFIVKIGQAAKAKDSSFTLMMQNAMSIIDHISDAQKKTLFTYVHGFGVEDLYYPGEGDNNREDFSKYGEYDQIKDIRKDYPWVKFFTVDYIPGLSSKEKNSYFKDARKKGLVPVVANRSLDGAGMVLSK